MNAPPVYLTMGEAAQQLGVSRRTLGRALDRGEIPCARQTPGGWALLLTTDVDAFAQRLSGPTPAGQQVSLSITPREGQGQRRGRARIPQRPAGLGAGVPLQDSEQRLWAPFDQAAIGIAQVALDGHWLRVNQRLCAILGYSPEVLLQRTVQEILPATEGDAAGDSWGVLLAGTWQTYSVEQRSLSRDGTPLWLTLTVSLVRDAADAPAFFVAVIEDISARKQAEEDLRQSEERFRLLVSSVRDFALYGLDPQGRVVIWNDGARRIIGYTAAEAVGQHVALFSTTEDRDGGVPQESLRQAAAQGHDGAEGWRVHKDGSRFWAEVGVTAMYDAQQRLIGFGVVTRDLTEPRRVVQEIRGLNASLEGRVAARTAELATVNRQLRAINEELESFAYSVSHDLRTPLRAISGFGEILVASYSAALDERGRHYLDRMCNGATQLGQLIDDLLALSRLTRAEMRATAVDLTALARAVAATLGQAEPERVVTWDITEGLTAHGDAGLLRVALDNLLGNAWKFTSRRPTARITLGARREEGQTVYFVRDDGAGFDMAYADKLFGAFQRLHTAREFAGTGIGLATVQRIIHRHGGRVWAQGAVEQGATISFTLTAPEGGHDAA